MLTYLLYPWLQDSWSYKDSAEKSSQTPLVVSLRNLFYYFPFLLLFFAYLIPVSYLSYTDDTFMIAATTKKYLLNKLYPKHNILNFFPSIYVPLLMAFPFSGMFLCLFSTPILKFNLFFISQLPSFLQSFLWWLLHGHILFELFIAF